MVLSNFHLNKMGMKNEIRRREKNTSEIREGVCMLKGVENI